MKQHDTKTPTKTVSKEIKEVKARKTMATTPEKEKALLDQRPESEEKESKGKQRNYYDRFIFVSKLKAEALKVS